MTTLLELIDAYAETRHACGDHTYNAKTAAARAAVIERAATVRPTPVGWVSTWPGNSPQSQQPVYPIES